MTRVRKMPAENVFSILIQMAGKSIRSELCELLDEGQECSDSAFCIPHGA